MKGKAYSIIELLIVACLLLLTACSPAQTTTAYGEMNFPGVKWMMTPEEVFQAIGKSKSDFQKAENGALSDTRYEAYYTTTGVFFGEEAEVQFTFCPTADRQGLRLWAASATIKDASEETYSVMCRMLDEEFKRQDVKVNTELSLKCVLSTEDGGEMLEEIRADADPYEKPDAVGYEKSYYAASVKQTTDLPEELKQKWKDGAQKFYAENSKGTRIEEVPAMALSNAGVDYSERKNSGEKSLKIWFSGTGICNILTYLE